MFGGLASGGVWLCVGVLDEGRRGGLVTLHSHRIGMTWGRTQYSRDNAEYHLMSGLPPAVCGDRFLVHFYL